MKHLFKIRYREIITLTMDLLLLDDVFLNIFVCKTTKREPKDQYRKCCCAVDIAYKRAPLYVWIPGVKSMLAQIVIDCQTQKETVSCGYCIVKENCYLRIEIENKIGSGEDTLKLLVPLLKEV